MGVDDYIRDVIQKGDKGSALLAAKTAPTLNNSKFAEVLDYGNVKLPVLRVPDDCYVVVHSTSGDPKPDDFQARAESLVPRLVKQANKIHVLPMAFSNIIDSATGENSYLESVADSLVEQADKFGVAIMNGENAILGNRLGWRTHVNVSGTMTSRVSKKHHQLPIDSIPGTFFVDGDEYAVFDPQGQAVFINSDGVGTKTEFYERSGNYVPAVRDLLAMVLDDASKIGATAKVVSGVVEVNNTPPSLEMAGYFNNYITKIVGEMGILGIMQVEQVGDRITSYENNLPAYNINGSAVSIINEEMLKKPLVPGEGEHLIAIRGKPNPRSNGITDKRKMMIDLFGLEWHETDVGKQFLEFLAEPSTILYTVFNKLISERLATSVYHMSGGAYNGKLAKPLAEHDLFVHLEFPFRPDWREWTFVGRGFTSARDAYGKWPMGNDGFVATSDPDKAKSLIESHGLEARAVGQIEKAVNGRTGVELEHHNGQTIYFSGTD